jgi:hypothetical protein
MEPNLSSELVTETLEVLYGSNQFQGKNLHKVHTDL